QMLYDKLERDININLNGIGDSIGNTAQDVGDSLNNAAKYTGNAIQNVTNTAIGGIDKLAQEAITAVLSAFDNFVLKVPTNAYSSQ
ncbi:11699_t:CDS:1, partial [Rhizophagus irregularis]